MGTTVGVHHRDSIELFEDMCASLFPFRLFLPGLHP